MIFQILIGFPRRFFGKYRKWEEPSPILSLDGFRTEATAEEHRDVQDEYAERFDIQTNITKITVPQTITVDGVAFTEVKATISGKGLKKEKTVKKILNKQIGGPYKTATNTVLMVGHDFPGEVIHSAYTTYLFNSNRFSLLRAKYRALSNVEALVSGAINERQETAIHPNNKDAKNGMLRHDVSWCENVGGNFRFYTGEIISRKAGDGNTYLYDLVNIKENTSAASAFKAGGQSKNSGAPQSASGSIIAQSNKNNNTHNQDGTASIYTRVELQRIS